MAPGDGAARMDVRVLRPVRHMSLQGCPLLEKGVGPTPNGLDGQIRQLAYRSDISYSTTLLRTNASIQTMDEGIIGSLGLRKSER
jgi:hypothetical protein